MTSPEDHMLVDLRLQAEAMTGTAALPRRDDGEPVFEEPWHGRAVAMAIEIVASLNVSWELFRTKLIAHIDSDPHRNYYESWLIALEELVSDRALASPERIDAEREAAASYRTAEVDPDDLEVFPVPLGDQTAFRLLALLFEEHWQHLHLGPNAEGMAFELRRSRRPTVVDEDDHIEIDLGGPTISLRGITHIELQRQMVGGQPHRWMVRLFNQAGQTMLTVIVPSPGHHQVWNQLRADFLQLPPQE